MTSNYVVWFRNDLRVCDHGALTNAIEHAKKNNAKLFAIYLWSPGQQELHGAGIIKNVVIFQALKSLSQSLAELGIPLTLLPADNWREGAEQLAQWCEQNQVTQVYCHYEPGWYETERDRLFSQTDSRAQLTYFNDLFLVDPAEILNKDGEHLKVFTAYRKRWFKFTNGQYATPLPKPPAYQTGILPPVLDQFEPTFTWPNPLQLAVTETQAHEQLESFLPRQGQYKTERDFPDNDGTSKLSVALSIGTLTSRQIQQALITAQPLEYGNSYFAEILWREFYKYLLYFRADLCRGHAFQPEKDAFPWHTDSEWLARWQQGKTGVPIVDAAMRQLNTTGWMHNRLRMITAMYLTKILQLNWRLGEQYFANKLADFDFAANNGGWQWCASTGIDAAPYFRIFNPYEQTRRFDPQGKFIRNYVPELAATTNDALLSPDGIAAKHYPLPVVDYKTARADTLSKFKQLQGNAGE